MNTLGLILSNNQIFFYQYKIHFFKIITEKFKEYIQNQFIFKI